MAIKRNPDDKLPIWAPRSLAEDYRQRVKELNWQEEFNEEHPGVIVTLESARIYIRVLKLLLSDARMRPAWAALRHQRGWHDKLTQELGGVVFEAVANFPHMSLRSRAQHRDFYRDIEGRAVALLLRIARAPCEFPSDLFVPVSPYSNWHEFGRQLGKAGLVTGTEKRVIEFAKQWFDCNDGPTFVDALRELCALARAAAKDAPELPKPRSKNALSHLVARRLNKFFRARLDTPLHRHVATITSVVTGKEIDETLVRLICRKRPSRIRLPVKT